MKDRLPVIVSRIADHLSKNREALIKDYEGEELMEELKSIISAMSQLRYEVMTNKPATPIQDDLPDAAAWNTELEKKTEEAGGEPPKWFESAWLWMECYLYRRIEEAPSMTKHLKSLDVFEQQKKDAFLDSHPALSSMTLYLMEILKGIEDGVTSPDINRIFTEFLQVDDVVCLTVSLMMDVENYQESHIEIDFDEIVVTSENGEQVMSLWGNKCDLSISAGSSNSQNQCPLEQLSKLESKILIDDTQATLQVLYKAKEAHGGQAGPVAIVLDNAGFELVTDLCFAEFLIASGLASSIHFHAKAMPWFVSDVTERDFHWVLETMSKTNHIAMSKLSQIWHQRLQNGTWTLHSHSFWTLPHSYSEMESVSPDLYSQLAKCDLVFFKGDLNYRKLVGDLDWDTTVTFSESLRGFHPAPLCALRALKADVVVGLQPGQAEKIAVENADWMVTGEYAVISLDC